MASLYPIPVAEREGLWTVHRHGRCIGRFRDAEGRFGGLLTQAEMAERALTDSYFSREDDADVLQHISPPGYQETTIEVVVKSPAGTKRWINVELRMMPDFIVRGYGQPNG